ncbi:PiT family inorganic phosphate transporter [Clostridiales Family XIII bacterium PM5-7]
MFYFMIGIGLIFAYINGMHDGGTVVATTISSRLISARKAVSIAGIANFLGAIALGTAVAYTISENIIDVSPILAGSKDLCYTFVAASFVGSLVWNVFTWIVKLPSSASHSMIGSMIGCGIAAYGLPYIQWDSIMIKVILAMLISPVIGFLMGFLFLKLQNRLLKNATIRWSKRIMILHKLSSFFLAFSYGSNDSQKVMGLIAIGLAGHYGTSIEIPLWLIFAAAAALSIGTMTGGYNMIKTVGMDICKIDIQNSFSSQMATISVITVANLTGLPISATQVITSSVMGVGTGNTPKSVNWNVTKKIILAWLITIPASAAIGALVFYGMQFI